MKRFVNWLSDLFSADYFFDINVAELERSMADPQVRSLWFAQIAEDVRQLNIEIDRRLLLGAEKGLTDLCARRKAIQDMLTLISSIKRTLTQERPNPRVEVPLVNLDRVTA